jgi:hypothetical protein
MLLIGNFQRNTRGGTSGFPWHVDKNLPQRRRDAEEDKDKSKKVYRYVGRLHLPRGLRERRDGRERRELFFEFSASQRLCGERF